MRVLWRICLHNVIWIQIRLAPHVFVMLSGTLLLGQSLYLNPDLLSLLIFNGKCWHGVTERYVKNLGRRCLARDSVLSKSPTCPPPCPALRKRSNCTDKGREMVHLILSISRSCCIRLFVFAGSKELSDCLQGDRVTSSFRSLFDQQHEQRPWTPRAWVSPRAAEGRSMSTHEYCTLSHHDWLLSLQATVVYLCFLSGASPGKSFQNDRKKNNKQIWLQNWLQSLTFPGDVLLK